jgi:NADH-quinone oxidoreductase subunit M
MLRLGQKLAWGEPTQAKAYKDLNVREWVYFAPLAVLVVYIGLAPGLTLKAMDPTLTRVLEEFGKRAAVTAASVETAAPSLDPVLSPRAAWEPSGPGPTLTR